MWKSWYLVDLPVHLHKIWFSIVGLINDMPWYVMVFLPISSTEPVHVPRGTEYLEFNLTEGDFYRVSDGGTYAVPCNPGRDS